MLEFDTTKLPGSAAEWQDLVNELVATDDYSETHYLEMKSALDMRVPAEFFKITKFILGAANRMPDDAELYFSGHALMVLGVKKGSADGIENPLESKDIRAKLNQYTGTDRIGWHAHYIPSLTNPAGQVVIIVVDPPQWGDPIQVCHNKFSQKVRKTKKPGECSDPDCPYPKEEVQILAEDGTIFVRPDGETKRATANDIKHLMERALSNRPAKLRVVPRGAALRITCDDRLLDRYLEVWGRYFHSEIPPNGPFGYSGLGAEHRSKKQYFGEVWNWAVAVEEEWTSLELAAGVAEQEANQVRFDIENSSNVSLRRPNLTIRFEGAVGSQQEVHVSDFTPSDLLPDPPVPFGTVGIQDILAAVSPRVSPYNVGRVAGRFDSISSDYTEDPEGLTLEVEMEDLRAHSIKKIPADGVYVVTYEQDVTELRATWTISAADHSRPPYTGELTLPIIDIDVTQLLARKLQQPKRRRS
ncbi:hypothetical protein [Nocardia brasiliensis]|uniref:hypothetical protein n=1 Tax=Nocardia brasiliensis TaxID=37326 RepID=UPI002459019B|nr:hypothetical protein [Nocardia brasiliensis]